MSRRVPNGVPENEVKKAEDKQSRLLIQGDAGHFSMIRGLHMADYVTAMNGFCGLMSIFSSMQYCLGPADTHRDLWIAMTFMPLGLFFDFMDGRVARWRKRSSLMGQELDSLADLVSFGASVACCAFAIGMRTPMDRLCLTFFFTCGLLRLARFNVTVATMPHDKTGKAQYFEGTPIPTSHAISLAMAYWLSQGWILQQLPGGVWGAGHWYEIHPIVGLFIGHGCLMVSKTLRIPKP